VRPEGFETLTRNRTSALKDVYFLPFAGKPVPVPPGAAQTAEKSADLGMRKEREASCTRASRLPHGGRGGVRYSQSGPGRNLRMSAPSRSTAVQPFRGARRLRAAVFCWGTFGKTRTIARRGVEAMPMHTPSGFNWADAMQPLENRRKSERAPGNRTVGGMAPPQVQGARRPRRRAAGHAQRSWWAFLVPNQ
jgi:hypothetical protein